jgi:hypothetical protein
MTVDLPTKVLTALITKVCHASRSLKKLPCRKRTETSSLHFSSVSKTFTPASLAMNDRRSCG